MQVEGLNAPVLKAGISTTHWLLRLLGSGLCLWGLFCLYRDGEQIKVESLIRACSTFSEKPELPTNTRYREIALIGRYRKELLPYIYSNSELSRLSKGFRALIERRER